MKKVIFTFLVLAFLPLTNLFSQPVYYTEGFETYDSTQYPPGWLVKYNRPYGPNSWDADWQVRDTGTPIPGLSTSLVKAYQSKKSMVVSWWMLDTVESIADTWLITKKFGALPTDALLTFYASGGSSSYADSMQVLISTTGDTAISSFTLLESVIWPAGSVYGNFTQTIIDLSSYSGATPRIAFRYFMDCTVDGYVVFVDNVQMLGTVGITQIGNNLPKKFALSQNYPNPFNPVTKIKFDVPKNGNVKLEVFNNLGQVVSILHNGYTSAGYYEASFDGSKLTSGMYFYRITSKDFVETKKMILVK